MDVSRTTVLKNGGVFIFLLAVHYCAIIKKNPLSSSFFLIATASKQFLTTQPVIYSVSNQNKYGKFLYS